jgi:hypothetical protein
MRRPIARAVQAIVGKPTRPDRTEIATLADDDAVVAMMSREARLEALVRWLALPYGDNVPVFATQLPDGRTLATGVMLRDLYTSLMGPSTPTSGTWQQCPTCQRWDIHSALLPAAEGGIGGPDVVGDLDYAK